MDPNTIKVMDADTYELLRTHPVHTFDLKQHKTSLDDWTMAFEKSIKKRTHKLNYDVFIGLSSGYDSGAISCALNRLKINHKSFTIVGNEDTSTITGRLEATKATNTPTILNLKIDEFKEEHKVHTSRTF